MARDGFHIIDCHHHVGLVPSLMASAADSGPVRFVPDASWSTHRWDESRTPTPASRVAAGASARGAAHTRGSVWDGGAPRDRAGDGP